VLHFFFAGLCSRILPKTDVGLCVWDAGVVLQHPVRRGQEPDPGAAAGLGRQVPDDGGDDAHGGGRGGVARALQGSRAQSDAPGAGRRRHAARLRARLRIPPAKVSALTAFKHAPFFLDKDLSFSTRCLFLVTFRHMRRLQIRLWTYRQLSC
jgi:hypothetical protein